MTLTNSAVVALLQSSGRRECLSSVATSELLELERQFWDAMKRKDGAAVQKTASGSAPIHAETLAGDPFGRDRKA
jgi:hypothetical protein